MAVVLDEKTLGAVFSFLTGFSGSHPCVACSKAFRCVGCLESYALANSMRCSFECEICLLRHDVLVTSHEHLSPGVLRYHYETGSYDFYPEMDIVKCFECLEKPYEEDREEEWFPRHRDLA